MLVLATWDLGVLVGAPMCGAVLKYSPSAGLPSYPTMFLVTAGLMALIGLWYAVAAASRPWQLAVSWIEVH